MDRLLVRLIPRAVALPRRQQRVVSWLFVALGMMVCASAVSVLVPGRASATFVDDWSSVAVYAIVVLLVAYRAAWTSTRRLPLVLLTVAQGLYGVGYVLWTLWIGHLQPAPIPSICDALWLQFYPLSMAAVVLLARGGTSRSLRAMIDGATVTCAVAALAAEVVLAPIFARPEGHSLRLMIELAYPMADLALATVVLGVLNLRGWRPDRMWTLLAGGFLLLAAADSAYALQISAGLVQPTELVNLVYLAGTALLPVAVWQVQREDSSPPVDPLAGARVPAAFAAVALGMLLYDHQRDLNEIAWTLAVVSVLGAVVRRVLVFRDTRALTRGRLHAESDELTSLPSRRVFLHRLNEELGVARAGDERRTLLVLDLDNFKQLNDTLGHDAGDQLLQLIGPRLQRVLRRADLLARLGGDEFGILLSAPGGADIGERVARKLRWVLERPFIVSGLPLRVTASIGISTFPADGAGAGDLLKHADVALYEAKTSRLGHAHYTPERNEYSRERLTLAHELAQAISRRELDVHFQPQADPSGTVRGAEALVRWTRGYGRSVPPAHFLPVAERAGLARDLTRLVLSAALDQVRVWRGQGFSLTVSVNTTVSDLLDQHFASEVGDALAVRGLPAGALVLEITETSVLSDPARIGDVLEQLSRLGVGLALDDFGTGFSSLAHLRFLPVAELKIDQTFVRGMRGDTADAAIVQATALLARELGLRLVAEGVEDPETWAAVAGWGCDLIQGHALSPALAAVEFTRFLRLGSLPAMAAARGGWAFSDTLQ